MQDLELNPEFKEDLESLLKHHSDSTVAKNMITKAFLFAIKAHEGVKRKSGEPYVTHPIAVAKKLCSMRADYETICAALLHDTLEDVDYVTKELLEKEFTGTIAKLVDGVTKVSPKGSTNKEEGKKRTVNKLILSIEEDPRIIIIKLIDRWHNTKTIAGHPTPEKRIEQAQQTLDIFVPLARMFSMYEIKDYLEEKCYEVIQKEKGLQDYEKLKSERQHKYIDNERIMEFISNCKEKGFITNILKNNPKIKFSISKPSDHVDFKFKTFSQIDTKIKELKLSGMEEIDDLIKIIINTNTVEDCYRALEEIETYVKDADQGPYFNHPFYFKDYIKKPAFNGYQSIHARYFVRDINQQIQIEYRTFEMKTKAIDGIASCWHYDRTAARNDMVDFLMKLPFYEDLKELCTRYKTHSEYKIKDQAQIEDELYNGLKERIFAKRIKVKLDDNEYQVYNGCTLGELLRKKHVNYLSDGSMFQINDAYVMIHQKLRDGDIITRVEQRRNEPSYQRILKKGKE